MEIKKTIEENKILIIIFSFLIIIGAFFIITQRFKSSSASQIPDQATIDAVMEKPFQNTK